MNTIELGTISELKNYVRSGLANDALSGGKTVTDFRIMREWSKNGSNKTKLGNIGAISSIGFVNVNELFEAWSSGTAFAGLFEVTPDIPAVLNPMGQVVQIAQVGSVKLIINPAAAFKVTGDEKGRIVKVEV